jgi:hypothetical protein
MARIASSRRIRRPLDLAIALSLALSLLAASDALALSWTANRALTGGGVAWAWPGSLAVSSSTIAHAVYHQSIVGGLAAFYRRSTNSGTTWGTPFRLSRASVAEGGVASIDAYGATVDAVWLEGDDILDGLDTVVMYRRSVDSGGTWGAAIPLTPTFESAGPPRVARRGSLVTVTWTNENNGRVYARVSRDGGSTWQPRVLIAITTRKWTSTRYEGMPVAAVGSGVVYIAYYSASHTVRIRRSLTSGATWYSPVSLATNGHGWDPTVAASGSTVIVGYASTASGDTWSVIRRSTDKGVHWGSAVALSARTSYPSFSPVITVRGTRWMAIYERCSSNTCSYSDVFYRASVNAGSTWSTATRASVRTRRYEQPSDVDVATKTLVLYTDYNDPSNDVFVRQGS